MAHIASLTLGEFQILDLMRHLGLPSLTDVFIIYHPHNKNYRPEKFWPAMIQNQVVCCLTGKITGQNDFNPVILIVQIILNR